MASNVSTFLANKVIDHILRGQAYSVPETVYASLHTAAVGDDGSGAEVSGGDYERTAIAFDAASSRATANTSEVTFPEASGDWGNIGWFGVWDAQTDGNLLLWGKTTVTKHIVSGQTASIAAAALTLTITAT